MVVLPLWFCLWQNLQIHIDTPASLRKRIIWQTGRRIALTLKSSASSATLRGTSPNETRRQEIDWESCTPEGWEREQFRVWSRLPLRRKSMALEEMGDLAGGMLAWRKAPGLPYIDPTTGEAMKPGPPGGP